jgi:diaminohydroxyphosphoribosylaminopyrimidine deaminase/5-amino-6-(5-phosphoribosylamino)uracil reductase
MADDPDTNEQTDRYWMEQAIDLSRRCSPSQEAYSVGVVIVGADGCMISHGFSRETDPHVHAEEAALAKLAPNDPRLRVATVYSTLEPCSQRHSPRTTCTQLLIAAGVRRVVIAWREPGLFAQCRGVELLTKAGIEVVELDDLAEKARRINTHLPGINARNGQEGAVLE